MDRTRSGRQVKRSSRLIDIDYRSGKSNTSGNDLDYDIDDDYTSEESDVDSHFDSNEYYGVTRHSSRISNKQTLGEGLTWKDGKLVPVTSSPVMPTLKPKRRLQSNLTDEIMNRINVVKDDPACRFYTATINALKHPNYSYPSITQKIVSDVKQTDKPYLDLLNDERFCLKLETKNQSLIPKYDKSNDKINEIVGISLDIEDIQRYARITGFLLFTVVNKKKSEITIADNGHSHRKGQDNWNTIPERTKRDWEIKAKQVSKLIDNKRRNDVTEDVAKKEKRFVALKKAEENIVKSKVMDHGMVDLAFYLKTVSTGMSKLSAKIAMHEGTVGVDGVESVMLDYLLCSLVSLVGIFQESEGLDKTSTNDSLNRLTFIMPGLNCN